MDLQKGLYYLFVKKCGLIFAQTDQLPCKTFLVSIFQYQWDDN